MPTWMRFLTENVGGEQNEIENYENLKKTSLCGTLLPKKWSFMRLHILQNLKAALNESIFSGMKSGQTLPLW